MLSDYLDTYVYDAIAKRFNLNEINEIRLRINQPIIISVGNKKYILKDNEPIFATRNIIDSFVLRISDNSIYAVNDDIVEGFITLPDGIRVGLAGRVVSEEGYVITIKEFTSVNIRIPHRVDRCSIPAIDYILEPTLNNTLILSPPGAGKTTFLRDIITQMSNKNIPINTLVVDERNEICSTVDGTPLLDVGKFCDIYTSCSKEYAFKNGIRSMSPDLIITDEIDVDRDLSSIIHAGNCGVKVIATIHANSIVDLKNKVKFETVFERKLFKRYIVLSKDNGPGTLNYIYDENFKLLYCRCV